MLTDFAEAPSVQMHLHRMGPGREESKNAKTKIRKDVI
jgi:hypothetical protein